MKQVSGSGRSEDVLSAVALAARLFARAAKWESEVPAVLEALGKATGVSRVYLYRNSLAFGSLVMTIRHEWCAPGVRPVIDDADNHGFPYEQGVSRWAEVLGAGEIISGGVHEFPIQERELLENEGVQSVLLAPVFASDEWWGFIGFDDVEHEHDWLPVEIDALRAAAEILGGAIERQGADRLRDEAEMRYQSLVEQIPAILYIDSAREDHRTMYVAPQIEKILGVDPQDWLDDPTLWLRIMHPDDVQWSGDQYKEWIASGEDELVQEYRMFHTSGELIWVRDDCRIVRDEDSGDALFVQGVMFDITDQKTAEEGVRAAEARFRRLVEQVPAVIYMDLIDENATTTYISPGIQALLGYTPEEWLADSDSWFSSLHPDDRDAAWQAYETGRALGEPWSFEFRMLHRDGSMRWVREEDMVVQGSGAEPAMVQGVMYDITEEREAVEHLREAETKYKAIIEAVPAVTYLDPVDENEPSIYVSPQIERILGCSQEDWLTTPNWWSEHVHPDDRDRVWAAYESHTERDPTSTLVQEYRMHRPDGRLIWIREESSLLLDEHGEPWLTQGLLHDVTDRKLAEEQIAFLAYHDKLTGLANRALLEEMLDPALARARRAGLAVALLFLDLDDFKEVNDTFGHGAGDIMLKEIANRLIEATRDTDVVARQGGDEFLVLLTDLDPGPEQDLAGGRDNAIQVAEIMAGRIHEGLSRPIPLGDAEVFTSASIGISVFPFDAGDSRMLMKNADAAMYESKRSGSGGFRVHEPGETPALIQPSAPGRVSKAVSDQDWVLYYQPVVELATGAITGVEALLRWRRPKGGLISPGEFLPIAEEMGLTEIIGEWVIDELAQQAAAWAAEGLELDMSFNLSPRQLWQRDLAGKITKSVASQGVDPARVIVEISESTAMTDPPRTQKVLWSLHERGFRVAIDDFGTSYSPPARLKHLPVDLLKLDQPLIRDLPEDPDVANFVQAVMLFAEELAITPLAVGVETEAQRAFLLSRGCRLAQGYLFSRPVAAEDIPALVQDAANGPDV